jgi:hypothetical protein
VVTEYAAHLTASVRRRELAHHRAVTATTGRSGPTTCLTTPAAAVDAARLHWSLAAAAAPARPDRLFCHVYAGGFP